MIKETTLATFEEDTKEGLVLLDFWAPWCTNCRMELPFLEKLDAQRGEEVKIVKVNVDAEEDLAKKFEVQTLPTLIYFKDGKEVQKTVGIRPFAKLMADVDALKS